MLKYDMVMPYYWAPVMKEQTIKKLADYPLFYEEVPAYVPRDSKRPKRRARRTQNVFED